MARRSLHRLLLVVGAECDSAHARHARDGPHGADHGEVAGGGVVGVGREQHRLQHQRECRHEEVEA
eukprot:525382-Prymnesium_polylepis.1